MRFKESKMPERAVRRGQRTALAWKSASSFCPCSSSGRLKNFSCKIKMQRGERVHRHTDEELFADEQRWPFCCCARLPASSTHLSIGGHGSDLSTADVAHLVLHLLGLEAEHGGVTGDSLNKEKEKKKKKRKRNNIVSDQIRSGQGQRVRPRRSQKSTALVSVCVHRNLTSWYLRLVMRSYPTMLALDEPCFPVLEIFSSDT